MHMTQTAKQLAGPVIDLSNLERQYRHLRSDTETTYSVSVGPRAVEMRRRQIARRREAGALSLDLGRCSDSEYRRGTGHDRQAERMEMELERDRAAYDETVFAKFLLAIVLGRYDFALGEGRSPGSDSRPGRQARIDHAAASRRALLTVGTPIHDGHCMCLECREGHLGRLIGVGTRGAL
jgi:hypothetical protein